MIEVTITIRDERTESVPLVFGSALSTRGQATIGGGIDSEPIRAEPSVVAQATRSRFEKVYDAAGVHVATIDHNTRLMYHVVSLGRPDDPSKPLRSLQERIDACAALRVLGYDDWMLSSRVETFAITDDTRCNPCVDPEYFPGIRAELHGTRTAVVGSPSLAWDVSLHDGYVDYGLRDGGGFALAVRRVGQ